MQQVNGHLDPRWSAWWRANTVHAGSRAAEDATGKAGAPVEVTGLAAPFEVLAIGTTPYVRAALARGTASPIAGLAGGTTCPAHAGLARGAAGGATVAGTLAAPVLGTTNRLGATRTGRATGVTQAFVMGSIADTLVRRWRISSKDRITELGTGAGASKETPREQRGEDRPGQGAANASQGLTARGTGRQGFGQFVKCVGFHFRSLLSQGTARTSWCQVGTRSQDSGSIQTIGVQGQPREFRKRAVGVHG